MLHDHRKPNPIGWRWRLVLWLTGGEIEAVPIFPARVIYKRERLIVKLGIEGALNTAEVTSMAGQTNELVEMRDWHADPQPNTFIAVDLEPGVRLVGTFLRWEGEGDDLRLVMDLANGSSQYAIPARRIQRAYWAPMGYRP